MATGIEWTSESWAVTNGCTIYTSGCKNCYAMKMARRLAAMGQAKYEGLTQIVNGNTVWTGEVRPDLSQIDRPLHWKKPRKIFVNSMSDLFHADVPFEHIDRVFAVMALCPQHTFQVLTKRTARMLEYMTEDGVGRGGYVEGRAKRLLREQSDDPSRPVLVGKTLRWPFPHVHLGTSVEDQARADERREPLRELAAQGWLTWVSYEPALGPVDWTGWEFLRWMVIGTESGGHKRPMEIKWAEDTIKQMRSFGAAIFVKQLPQGGHVIHDINLFPDHLKIREFPE